MNTAELQERVARAATNALADNGFVAPLDVLVRMRWLEPVHVDQWRQGRLPALERAVQVNLHKLSTAMAVFRRWAREQGLKPSETDYVARTRDRRRLQFSVSGDPETEKAYRTHWVSPSLSEAKRQRLAEKQSRPPELVVVNALSEWSCTECGGTGDLLIMEEPGPLCLSCADLGHLVFLPRGDTALTRRTKKASSLSAVVVRFSRTRKRYERQGLLVEEPALEQAEAECLADEHARARRRQREESRRAEADLEFEAAFATAIRELFPGCPSDRAQVIAAHAALRRSGRVGRSAAGRKLEAEAVTLAVVASVRHSDTPYDSLLMSGVERAQARAQVRSEVDRVLTEWSVRPPAATWPGDTGRGKGFLDPVGGTPRSGRSSCVVPEAVVEPRTRDSVRGLPAPTPELSGPTARPHIRTVTVAGKNQWTLSEIAPDRLVHPATRPYRCHPGIPNATPDARPP